MTVVKVGGSLFDLPDLDQRLVRFLFTLNDEVIVVPGGGPQVDQLRQAGGDEETCHWQALEIMSENATMVARLIKHGMRVLGPLPISVQLLYALTFARQDEQNPERLPHSWDVTSDAIAARVAEVYEGEELILLKSIGIATGDAWREAAMRGYVDKYFATVAGRLKCPIRLVNLRKIE